MSRARPRQRTHSGSVTNVTEELLHWFEETGRDLPWRQNRTPYRVLVAEVMLQQTQVATVAPYFERWLERFPTLQALAEVPLDDVLKAWEGLGYYRRARLLHEAARVVRRDHSGELPRRYDELLELPGIGTYSAAAVASLAFGENVLAVDGNVKRVASRLFTLPQPTEKAVKEKLLPHLPRGQAGAFNEALMELGALLCTPRTPRCDVCPVSESCEAFRAGRVAEFPPPKPKKNVPHIKRYAIVRVEDEALWLRKRGEKEMLGGLWGFPLAEEAVEGERLESVTHAYTHFKITATPVLVSKPPEDGGFVLMKDLSKLALSRLDHKIYETLKAHLASLEALEVDAEQAEHPEVEEVEPHHHRHGEEQRWDETQSRS